MEKKKLIIEAAKAFVELSPDNNLEPSKHGDALSLWPIIKKNFLELTPEEIGGDFDVTNYSRIQLKIENLGHDKMMGNREYAARKPISNEILKFLPSSTPIIGLSDGMIKQVMCIHAFDNSYFDELYGEKLRNFFHCHFNFKCVNGKRYHQSNIMKMDKIYDMIKQSEIILIDLSKNRPNIFIELGISFKTIEDQHLFFFCREDYITDDYDPRKIFDIVGRDIIVYKNYEDLISQIWEEFAKTIFKKRFTPVNFTWSSQYFNLTRRSRTDFRIDGAGCGFLNEPVSIPFILSTKMKLIGKGYKDGKRTSDLRFHYSSTPNLENAGLSFISPWEGSIDDMQLHINCSTAYQDPEALRKLGEARVANVKVVEGSEYLILLTINHKEVIFEVICGDQFETIIIPLSRLTEIGINVEKLQFIGIEGVVGKFDLMNFELASL